MALTKSGTLVVFVVSVVSTACGGTTPGPSGDFQSPNARGAAPREIAFAPTSPAARYYNETGARQGRMSPGEQIVFELVAGLAGKLGRPALTADARLSQACAEIGRVALPGVATPYSLIEFEMQRQGIIEPSPHLLFFWGPAEREETLKDIRKNIIDILKNNAYTRLGVASIQRPDLEDSITVIALQQSFVRTVPIPRRATASSGITIAGEVLPPYGEVALFVTHDDGQVETLAAEVRGKAFRARVSCAGHHGKQQVEVTASDRRGASVLANFPVWCGIDPPRSFALRLRRDQGGQSARAAESRLLELTNQARTAQGMAPLKPDERLTAIARAHSEDMYRNRFVAHVSPTTGSAADRVAAAKFPAVLVLENVSRTYSADESHEGFMNSPGHRGNILAKAATHVGVGVAIGQENGRDVLFVTELFARVAIAADPGSASADIAKKIESTVRLDRDSTLDRLAGELARANASGKGVDSADWDRALNAAARSRFSRVTTVAAAVLDPAQYDPPAVDKGSSHYGLGVARGRHPKLGQNALFIVVLVAEAIDDD